MTDTEPVATDLDPEGIIYTHPKIREKTHHELLERLDQIRGRRLVAAMEFKTAERSRLDKEHDKLSDQWTKLAAKLSKKEYSIREDIEKFEADVNKLIQIHNQASVLETGQ